MLKTKTRKPQQPMVPIHIKITEEMYDLLHQVSKDYGFPRIQGLIRLYIRRGLDAENVGYCLAKDSRFLDKLKRQGVSEEILLAAMNRDDLDDADTSEDGIKITKKSETA